MKRLVLILMMFAVMLVIATPSFAKTKAQKQADVRKLADQTLAMRRGPPRRPRSKRLLTPNLIAGSRVDQLRVQCQQISVGRFIDKHFGESEVENFHCPIISNFHVRR